MSPRGSRVAATEPAPGSVESGRPCSSTPSGEAWQIAALSLIYFLVVARLRIVDDDEGYYLLAGRAWLEGLLPYRDFFFPQMPLTALLYGVWGRLFGLGIVKARLLCAGCAALTTTVVYAAARRAGGRPAGVLAVLLFGGHLLIWEWAVTAKTFCVALLLPALALGLATSPGLRAPKAVLAGVFCGLGVAARLLTAPLVGCVLLAVWQGRTSPAQGRRLCGAALGGWAVALLPVAILASMAPEGFWFGNLGYHALRGQAGSLISDLPQKLQTAMAVLVTPLHSSRPDATGLQTTPLLLGALFALRRGSGAPPGSAAFSVAALVMALVSFLPSPTWTQYFANVVPFAAVAVGVHLARAWQRWPRAVASGVAAYLLVAVPSFHDRLVARYPYERAAAVDAVGRALDGVTAPGERVAAHWPSYLAASSRAPLPEARSQFARLYSERVPEERRRALHLYTEADLLDALLAGKAGAFVLGLFVVPETVVALRAQGWQRAVELDGASIWTPPGRARPLP